MYTRPLISLLSLSRPEERMLDGDSNNNDNQHLVFCLVGFGMLVYRVSRPSQSLEIH